MAATRSPVTTPTSSGLSYWLGIDKAGNASVVQSAAAPSGFSYTSNLGSVTQSLSQIEQNLAGSLLGAAQSGFDPNLPSSDTIAIPAKGTAKINPSVTAQIGQTISGAANTLSSWEQAVAKFFGMVTSTDFWKGAGLCVGGAILVILGLKHLTGVRVP